MSDELFPAATPDPFDWMTLSSEGSDFFGGDVVSPVTFGEPMTPEWGKLTSSVAIPSDAFSVESLFSVPTIGGGGKTFGGTRQQTAWVNTPGFLQQDKRGQITGHNFQAILDKGGTTEDALKAQKQYPISASLTDEQPLYKQQWFWTAALGSLALGYQMYSDRENRKLQIEMYNQQLKLRKEERDEDYNQAVSMAQLQNSLAIGRDSAGGGGGVTRGGFENYSGG